MKLKKDFHNPAFNISSKIFKTQQIPTILLKIKEYSLIVNKLTPYWIKGIKSMWQTLVIACVRKRKQGLHKKWIRGRTTKWTKKNKGNALTKQQRPSTRYQQMVHNIQKKKNSPKIIPCIKKILGLIYLLVHLHDRFFLIRYTISWIRWWYEMCHTGLAPIYSTSVYRHLVYTGAYRYLVHQIGPQTGCTYTVTRRYQYGAGTKCTMPFNLFKIEALKIPFPWRFL